MEDDVFRFEIAVDNLIFMHVIQSAADLLHYIFGGVLGDSAPALQKAVKLTRKAELEDQVDVAFVCEEGKHFDYVGVAQETLDLYLTHHLHDHRAVYILLLDLF